MQQSLKEGYPAGHATALVACSSVLALMIPPSIPMIVFAVTGGISVGAAFLSTVIPGVILTFVYVGLNFLFLMSRAMILQQVPKEVAEALVALTENRVLVLLMINVILLLIGMIVDDVSGSVLAAIVLLPVANEIGVHPIHFAAIVGTNLGLGNVSPPCAPMLYMAAGVSKLTLDKYVVPTMKLLVLGHLPMVLVVTFFPDLSLALPRLLLGIQ